MDSLVNSALIFNRTLPAVAGSSKGAGTLAQIWNLDLRHPAVTAVFQKRSALHLSVEPRERSIHSCRFNRVLTKGEALGLDREWQLSRKKLSF